MSNTSPITVMLVDDDPVLQRMLTTFFTSREIGVIALTNASDLVAAVARERPSVIVLDVMMPLVDGFAALGRLRGAGDPTPVIMLTARDEHSDRLLGLEMGADDYVGKPFLPQELLARVQAVWRRHQYVPDRRAAAPALSFGRFEVDPFQRRVTKDGEDVRLGHGEFELLYVLLTHPLEKLSRRQLLELWTAAPAGSGERALDMPIWRLRGIIEADPAQPTVIRTLRGFGYLFVPPERQSDVDVRTVTSPEIRPPR
ncbi:response regulator [Robbsia sp. Bb-Pol-6]|uniref:Response regulator n=1 Tax=Robbsia betulipollinis TaxID=2981849 RepID=A0ABT3ZKX8_9BURK|nr:response regulator [Robbsia betulipollinis]MCY0386925.1 response regulator [Robbsia betulipollinis]